MRLGVSQYALRLRLSDVTTIFIYVRFCFHGSLQERLLLCCIVLDLVLDVPVVLLIRGVES